VGLSTLQNVAAGIMQLIKALISLNYLGALDQNLDHDLTRRNPNATRTSAAPTGPPANPQLLVKSLRYTYPGAARPVVRDASLSLPARRKLLLSGTSGSGKSTFGALLAGRLEPDAGAVLSDGIDRHIVGASDWHRYICYVPQFSNNHVLTDTFAFNLLLGRSWPPSQDDLRAAYEVAGRLGLGELIEKMPAGMMQMVGEGGWHLSQGERSRLFVARGILQRANVLIADELLSPLDPDTGLNVMKTLEALDSQLILIAHT
jgi:ABC-type bacteriocin/lantibiotic exporter with double-glycine peptidase domain